MRPVISILVGLLIASATAHADANDGEFMGFQIGTNFDNNKVPLKGGFYDEWGEGLGPHWWVLVEPRDISPEVVDSIELRVTPVSRTIGSIYANAFIDSESEARAIFINYRRALPSQYPSWEFSSRGPAEYTAMESFELEGNEYYMYVGFHGKTGDGRHTVYDGSLPGPSDMWQQGKWLIRFVLAPKSDTPQYREFHETVVLESGEIAREKTDLLGL